MEISHWGSVILQSTHATDQLQQIEKQIYFVAIKVFLCHLHSNRHVYAERHRNKDEIRDGGVGGVVILSHTTFLRQNGVAFTRQK